MEVILRPRLPEIDNGLIYTTWCNGKYYGTDPKPDLSWGKFIRQWSVRITEILKIAKTIIACTKDNPEFIVGYAVVNENNLEWVFVKERMRKQGIATLLIKNEPIQTFSSPTVLGRAIAEKYQLKEKDYGHTRQEPSETHRQRDCSQ